MTEETIPEFDTVEGEDDLPAEPNEGQPIEDEEPS